MPLTDALPDMDRELRFFPVENEDPQAFTKEQVAQYNELGYVFPIDIFTAAEAEANRRYFDSLMARAAEAGLNSYSINGWHRCCRGLYDLVHEPRILQVVQDLLGPDLVLVMTHYFSKEPGDPMQVSWHQDASYWPLTPSKVVTVWLAIDDADEENGAMEFIPRSHLHGQIPFEHTTKEDKAVLGQKVSDPQDWGDPPVSVNLKAGQISMHSDLLLHGSGPNRSSRRRCGLTMRYMPPDVRGRSRDHQQGIICSGTDPSGYWQPQPRPEGDEVPGR